MTEQKNRFECYLNIQIASQGIAVIISGTGKTKEEAQALFDHSLKTYREEKQ